MRQPWLILKYADKYKKRRPGEDRWESSQTRNVGTVTECGSWSVNIKQYSSHRVTILG